MDTSATHRKKINTISSEIKTLRAENPSKEIRFTHGSTNSTRVQDKSNYNLINISELDKIITIDKVKGIALVEPNVSMDQLVDACITFGFIPQIVMEFPGITCGGAVNGASLEASSFKYGQFNDTCREYEVILGNGDVITINKEKNADLFYGISGSYGSIALVTLIKLELIPAKPYVNVSFQPVKTTSLVDILSKEIEQNYDYLEGVIVDREQAILIMGKLSEKTDALFKTFSKVTDDWFILYAREQLKYSESHILIPIKDYLFRYNRGAFWMGEYAFKMFHTPLNKLTKFLLNPFMNTRTMYTGLHDTNIAQAYFIQDFYLPLSQTEKFLQKSFKELDIFPVWLCPIKATRNPQKLSPHYLKEKMLMDVGIWGPIPQSNGSVEKINKKFEAYLHTYRGRKMFYAESFYSEQEFWKIYDKKWYFALRKKYKAEGTFPTIWEKVTVKRRYKVNKKRILKTMFKSLFPKFSSGFNKIVNVQ